MIRSRDGVRAALLLAVLGLVAVLAGALAGPVGIAIMALLVGALGTYGWWFAERTALRAMQAYAIGEAQQPMMFGLVRELSTATRQPMPALYVSPTPAPNAFAIGRGGRRAAICCTEGLLARLDERELRGVLGHEIAHIARRDVATAVTATLAAAVLRPAQLAWRPAGRRDDEGGGPIARALLMVLAPIAACLLALGIRRSREYEADAACVALTGDPLGLAQALRSLDAGTRALPLRPEPALYASGVLMIVGPFRPGLLTRMLDPRPQTAERVARLERRAGYRR